MQTGLFMISKFFRCVEHHRCQTRSGICLIRRKADVREKNLAAFASATGLHDCPEKLLVSIAARNIGESGEVPVERTPRQRSRSKLQHAVCSLICHEYAPVRIRRDDGGGAAFY